jgi:type II secretory pathway pseudopilin PulG
LQLNPIANPKSQIANRRAFTLVEATIASVVLSVCVVALSTTLSASYQQNRTRGQSGTAIVLAQQLMEEIASKPIDAPAGTTDKPGFSAGQSDRRFYDTIGDYNGYVDTASSVELWDGSSVDLSDGGSYVRSVSVQTNARPAALNGYGNAGDFVLVTVTVTMPSGQRTALTQLFTRVTMYR